MANNFATPEQLEEINSQLLDKMRDSVHYLSDEEFEEQLQAMTFLLSSEESALN